MDDPDRAAGMQIAGAIDKMDHKQMYHSLLDMPHSQWEAIRESAHQMLGGSASDMWGEIDHDDSDGAGYHIGGGYNMHDLKDVILTPSPAAAARMVELEHDAKSGGFHKAVKKAWAKSQKFFGHANKGLSKVNKGLDTVNKVTGVLAAVPSPFQEYAISANEAGKSLHEGTKAAEDVSKKLSETSLDQVKDMAVSALKDPNTYVKIADLANKAQQGDAGSMNTGGAMAIAGSATNPQPDAGGMPVNALVTDEAPMPEEKGKRKRKGAGACKKKAAGLKKPKVLNAKEPKMAKEKPKKMMKQPSPEAINLTEISAASNTPMLKMKGHTSHDPRKRR